MTGGFAFLGESLFFLFFDVVSDIFGELDDFVGDIAIDGEKFGQFGRFEEGEVAVGEEAFGDECFDHFGGHVGDLGEPFFGAGEAFVEFFDGHDFDIPTDEFGGEADVLSATADGEGELIFGDEDDGASEAGIEEDFGDFGGLEGVRDEDLEGVVPADDVDAFAAEFVDDVFDTAAADADTSADGIDFGVDAGDGNFGAVAGLPSDGADFDGAVLDFGDFLFEEAADEIGVAAGEDDADPMAGASDFHDDGADASADLEGFAGDHFAAGEEGFGLVDHDDGGALVEALDGAGDDFALPAEEFLEGLIGLGLADFLDDEIFGGLGGNASELFGVDLERASSGEDVAGEAVDGNFDGVLLVLAQGTFDSDAEGVFDAGEDDVLGDFFVFVHFIDDQEDVRTFNWHKDNSQGASIGGWLESGLSSRSIVP